MFRAGFLLLAVSSFGGALDGWHWRHPYPQGNTLVAAAHGNEQFVAVGTHGTILTSRDGLKWNSRDSATYAQLSGVAFASGRWVITGAGGTILTSSDAAPLMPSA